MREVQKEHLKICWPLQTGGLIGSVSKVEDHSTTINLLTNTENSDKISVKILHGSTEIYGIIVGYDKESELLKISQLNSNSDISAGRQGDYRGAWKL